MSVFSVFQLVCQLVSNFLDTHVCCLEGSVSELLIARHSDTRVDPLVAQGRSATIYALGFPATMYIYRIHLGNRKLLENITFLFLIVIVDIYGKDLLWTIARVRGPTGATFLLRTSNSHYRLVLKGYTYLGNPSPQVCLFTLLQCPLIKHSTGPSMLKYLEVFASQRICR